MSSKENNISIEHQHTFETYIKSGINLFLGSGFSTEAKSTIQNKLKTLPVGSELENELKIHFNKPTSKHNLSELCQVLSNTKKNELNQYLSERFTITEYSDLYKNLFKINVKSIFTTNIDDLIFKIYEGNPHHYINDINNRGALPPDQTAIQYLALHGCVYNNSGQSTFDFTPPEIAASFDKNKVLWSSYQLHMQQYPTLYWGYSVRDSGVLQAIYKNNSEKKAADAWIILRNNDIDDIEYFQSLNMKIIISDTSSMLKYLEDLSTTVNFNNNNRFTKNNTISAHFPEYSIPTKSSKLAVRKIDEFYLGNEPTWYDIIHGSIHKTKYFYDIQNKILANTNIIILGSQVSGKTTLLRQLALAVNTMGLNSLYIQDISPEKAEILFQEIKSQSERMYIFIDNIADSWESATKLTKLKNVTIVGAERDFIFDSVAHRFPKEFIRHEISSLNLEDIQAISELIPNLRKKPLTTQHIFQEFEPTFFDLMQEKGIYDEYSIRFMKALEELKELSPIKYDILLLCCYCYHCRVPLSISMVISYITSQRITSELQKGIPQLFQFITELNNYIAPYDDKQCQDNDNFQQDHYITRSKYLSKYILEEKLPKIELRHLLETFHTNISTTSITRYDIFKRSAYDANIIEMAYPNWDEGIDFYKTFQYRDDTYHFPQQAAVYLLRKSKFQLAFEWIEKARKKAKGHSISSVNNTYAIILFAANINTPSPTPEIMATLHESMDILMRCYQQDAKKPYHAKVFSDQAIKYAQKFKKTEKSTEYLNQAEEWIKNQLELNKANRSLLYKQKALRREIETISRGYLNKSSQ